MRSGRELWATDPQGGASVAAHPRLPTSSMLPWNSMRSAAVAEIQTRLRYKDRKRGEESLTAGRVVGLVGLAPTRELAEVQLRSVLGLEGLSHFVSYEFVYEQPWTSREHQRWFLYKLRWAALPSQMPTRDQPELADVVERASNTPEARRRRHARTAFVAMSAIVLRYGISQDELLYRFATEFLRVLERGAGDQEKLLMGVFSFNYRRHLSKRLEWAELTRRFFDPTRAVLRERHDTLVTQLPRPLQLNMGFFTWYTVYPDERKRLEQALLVLRVTSQTPRK